MTEANGSETIGAGRARGTLVAISSRHGEPFRARLAALVDSGAVILRGMAPVVDLLVRLSLAKPFFDPGMHLADMMAAPGSDSWPVIIVQIAGPVLLATGFLVRPVALLLLVLASLQAAAPLADEHLFLMALFGWYLVQGAGTLSLDHLLDKGLGFSPLPLAGTAIAVAHWVDRHVAPIYRLALRIWLAAALFGPPLLLAGVPQSISGMLPGALAVAAAGLLVIGLGTPMVAAAVIFSAASMTMAGAEPWARLSGITPYGPLLLALLGTSGAGRLSLDRLVGWLVHRRSELADDAPHIVIVGAGFGGLACAAGLRHARARVTLIDRQNHTVFQPLLYQVATGSLSPADIATPICPLFRDDPNIRVLCGSVTGVDTEARQVLVNGRGVGYDALVLATGATHGYFGNEHWAAHAPGLKSVADATAIRSRILDAFEQAEATDDAARRAVLLTFVIVGAGPTGLELAGAIAELSRHGFAKDFRNFDPATARILLVQAGPRVLPQFEEKLSTFAGRAVASLGVEVLLDSRVESIDADGVIVNGERIAAGTVLWAAGVAASPAAGWLGVPADRAGRIVVEADLSIAGRPEIFAIGDTSLVLGGDGAPVPGLAPAAKQGGDYVAAVVRARIKASRPPSPFRYRHQGSLATIGRKSAVADFGWLKLTGALAWWLWGGVHVLFLGGFRNRASVVMGWVWSYFSFEVGVRLITGSAAPILPREAAPAVTAS